MKSFLISIIIIFVVTYIIFLALPWWTIPIATFIVGIIFRLKSIPSFLSGFLGVGIVWLVLIVSKDAGNDVNIASAMGELFGGRSGYMVYILSGLIGGLMGGLASLTGSKMVLAFYNTSEK